jgi:hypothetical protein
VVDDDDDVMEVPVRVCCDAGMTFTPLKAIDEMAYFST